MTYIITDVIPLGEHGEGEGYAIVFWCNGFEVGIDVALLALNKTAASQAALIRSEILEHGRAKTN